MSNDSDVIYTTSYTTMQSPIGRLTLTGDGRALTSIFFERRRPPGVRAAEALDRGRPAPARRPRAARRVFRRQADGVRSAARAAGHALPDEGLARAAGIRFGATASYGEIATAIGHPGASRAVGGANHRNPIPIIVPCHRVIGSDGSLTGYGGGEPTKRRLLALEGVSTPEQLALA